MSCRQAKPDPYMTKPPLPANSVLITGASSGIGRACALHMDRLGWQVFAGVRKQKDAQALRREASSRLTPVLLDVTKTSHIRRAAQQLDRFTGKAGLTGLVNNAGVPYGGPIEFLDVDQLRKAFEVNFFGAVAVTQALIPLLRRGRGRIVNISSVSGLVAAPFLSPYSTGKFALEAFSDALRLELSPWKIRVAVVEPGAIDTPIWDKAHVVARQIIDREPAAMEKYGTVVDDIQRGLSRHGISVEAVAKVVAHALTSAHPRTRYQMGSGAFLVPLVRLLPDALRDRLLLARLPKWG